MAFRKRHESVELSKRRRKVTKHCWVYKGRRAWVKGQGRGGTCDLPLLEDVPQSNDAPRREVINLRPILLLLKMSRTVASREGRQKVRLEKTNKLK